MVSATHPPHQYVIPINSNSLAAVYAPQAHGFSHSPTSPNGLFLFVPFSKHSKSIKRKHISKIKTKKSPKATNFESSNDDGRLPENSYYLNFP